MEEDYPKEAILKDGTGVTLRPLQEGDQGPLARMFNRLPEDDRWFLDHDVADHAVIEDWVKDRDMNRVFSIVAVLEGEIIGHATLLRKYYGSKSHIGKIRISVDPSFRERHLGTWMLLELINTAMETGLETLIVSLVRERDSSMIRSVKKLDFFEDAVLRDYVKDRGGIPHDLIIMVKRLHRGWEDLGVGQP